MFYKGKKASNPFCFFHLLPEVTSITANPIGTTKKPFVVTVIFWTGDHNRPCGNLYVGKKLFWPDSSKYYGSEKY